ncbi:hypothetical protein CC79DRAFT_158505 [Sarocladium strictum]
MCYLAGCHIKKRISIARTTSADPRFWEHSWMAAVDSVSPHILSGPRPQDNEDDDSMSNSRWTCIRTHPTADAASRNTPHHAQNGRSKNTSEWLATAILSGAGASAVKRQNNWISKRHIPVAEAFSLAQQGATFGVPQPVFGSSVGNLLRIMARLIEPSHCPQDTIRCGSTEPRVLLIPKGRVTLKSSHVCSYPRQRGPTQT